MALQPSYPMCWRWAKACVAFLLSLMVACDGDTPSTFARHPAFVRIAPVNTTVPLFHALNAPGQWCAITYDAHHYHFRSHDQAAALPRTALDAYGQPRSIAGFLVGTPSLPEPNGQHQPRAYDLVCPSCYRSALIERALTLDAQTPDRAHCPRCQRDYNLATGTPLNRPDQQEQAPLYRYRLQYAPAQGVMVVQN